MSSSGSQHSYDLTPVMAPFFDTHMVSSLLDHLREAGIYDAKTVTKEKIRTLDKTNLVDVIEEEYARFPDDDEFQKEFRERQPLFEARRDEIFNKLDNVPEAVTKVSEFFTDEDLVKQLKEEHTLTPEYLATNKNITAAELETYYKYTKFLFECGQYAEAEAMLENYLSVQQSPQSGSVLGALWGRLACRIVQAKWDLSLTDLEKVKEAIEGRHIAPTDQLRQRAWLLHWGLLVYINQREGADALTDFFSERAYLQTLENLCPWLLRYYTAFVVLSKSKRRTMLRDLLQEIQSMEYQYSDPITEFLASLFKLFDFDEAQIKLMECQELIKNDFFLQIYADSFMKEARLLICEMYCSINRNVDIVMLSQKLQLSEEEAEKWMVDIVRNATSGPTYDAKIDSSAKQVTMSTPSRMAHQSVMDKTKELTVRSSHLASNLTGLLNDQSILIRDVILRGKNKQER